MKDSIRRKLEKLDERYEEISRLLSDAGVISRQNQFRELSMEYARLGPLVERYPELTGVLDRWAADPDFWIRRSALLSLLLPLRRGAGDFARFSRYADQMLDEREFFIRKAIGWVLREISKRDPDWVASWTGRHLSEMSGVTFREAVRRLPAAEAARLAASR